METISSPADISRKTSALLLSVLLLSLIFSIRRFFSPGVVAAWDAGMHLLRGRFLVDTLLHDHRFDAWFPYWFNGFDFFATYSPLSSYLLGLIDAILGPDVSLRLFMVVTWLLLPVCSYSFFRCLEVPRWFSLAGAFLSILVNAYTSFGFDMIFYTGLLPHAAALDFALMALGFCWKYMARFNPWRLGIVVALSSSIVVLLHQFVALWFFEMFAVMAVVHVVTTDRKKSMSLSLMGGLGVGAALSSFWWFAFLLNSPTMARVVTFGPIDGSGLFRELSANLGVGGSVLAIVGAGFLFSARRLRLLTFFLGALIVSSLQTLGKIPFPFALVNPGQASRFQGFVYFGVCCFAAMGVWSLADFSGRRSVTKKTMILALVVSGFLMGRTTVQRWRVFENRPLVRNNSQTQSLSTLIDLLQKRLRPGEWVMSENSDGTRAYGSFHFVNQQLPLRLGTWDVGGNYPESIGGANGANRITKNIATIVPISEAYLRKRGVAYVVTLSKAADDSLAKLPWLERLWVGPASPAFWSDHLALFAVKNFDSTMGLPAKANEKLRDVRFTVGNGYEMKFSDEIGLSAGTTLALNYHPWLRVRAGDQMVKTESDGDGTLVLTDAARPSALWRISYEPPRVIYGVQIFSLCSWLIFLLALPSFWRRPSVSQSPSALS